MSKRTILTGVGSYVNKHGVPTFGFKGEEVDVNDDFLEEFDAVNVENGDGEEVTYERVGVNMISPLAAAQAPPKEEDEEEPQPTAKKAPAEEVIPYATVDDLVPERFPRALTPVELAQVDTMFKDASFLLSIKAPDLQAAIDGGNEQITYAAMLLTVAMVKRALIAQANQLSGQPMADQVSEAWGPYNRSVKYKTDNGNLFLYGSELESLLALLRGDTAAAVSMRSPGF